MLSVITIISLSGLTDGQSPGQNLVSVESKFNANAGTCTCTYMFSPPPCAYPSKYRANNQSSDQRSNDASPDMIRPINTSAQSTVGSSTTEPIDALRYTSRMTPWESIVAQTLFRLTKVHHRSHATEAWERFQRQIEQRDLTNRKLDEVTTVEHFNIDELAKLMPLLGKHRPSFSQLKTKQWKNRNWTVNLERAQPLPRPMHIYQRLETLAVVYNYAIFEPICSVFVFTWDANLLDICLEYWFTAWPTQSIPDYHCSDLSAHGK